MGFSQARARVVEVVLLTRIKSVEELELEGRRVLIRVDLNCPVDDDGVPTDDSRILAALPTIQYARERGAKVLLCSHLGRPKGRPRKELSLVAIGERLSELLKTEIFFPDDCIGDGPKKLAMNLREGQVILLENVRFHKGEAKNDDTFARGLASLAQVYINDAFGCAHRPHASIALTPRFVPERGAGLLFLKEVRALQLLLPPEAGRTSEIKHPFVVAVGGGSTAARIGVAEAMLAHADHILVGGVPAYTFLHGLDVEVGRSPVDEEKLAIARRILLKADARGVPVELPSDHVVVPEISADAPTKVVRTGHIPKDAFCADIGPETAERFASVLRSAATVLWTGPMGAFEHAPFASGTMAVASAVARASTSTVIGRETAQALRDAGVVPFITHISTGGSAALEFLEGRELPGIEALRLPRRGGDTLGTTAPPAPERPARPPERSSRPAERGDRGSDRGSRPRPSGGGRS
ncbi:MAG: phosphoglycerate kinase [Myxococcales bacterium]|nr:phosphoglycerate kinase [Myxococcales bacterium]